MPGLVSLDEIEAAAARLPGVALRTQLVPVPGAEPPLLVKPESLQPTGSFKLRGAYAAISALPDGDRRRGVIAHSSGNHGLAVAYSAALLGIQATVVVPANAAAVKRHAIRDLGARLVSCEPGLAARTAVTQELSARYGYAVIPPFEHRSVIAGQGTIGLEIAADRPDADLIACPVGGGGLISGIAAAIAAVRPEARVIGVEPELAADARDSLRLRRRTAWPASRTHATVADALRAEQVGELAWQHLQCQVREIVTVSEQQIVTAMRVLATRTGLIAEPAGAVATAACLFRAAELPPSRVRVAVVSGRNVDPELLASVLGSPRGGAPAGD